MTDELQKQTEKHVLTTMISPFLPAFLRKLHDQLEPSESSTQIFNELLSYITDPGIAQESSFLMPDSEVELHAPGEAILNRTGLVNYIESQIEMDELDRNNITFRLLDISDFRQADFAKDDYGNSYADYMVNTIASVAMTKISEINQRLKETSGEVVFSRYGGDEFALAFCNVSAEERESIYKEISTEITSLKGYFLRENGLQLENIALKPGLEEIHPPETGDDKIVFWQQFRKGLILSNEEVAQIRERNSEEVISEIFPSEPTEFQAEIEKLSIKHPELISILAKAKELGSKEGNETIERDTLRFIKEAVYDRLLGEKVTTFTDFQKHLSDGQFREVRCFDLKGIKEINDFQSIAAGDQAITVLFDQLRTAIGNDFDKLMMFRRGSTIMIGVKNTLSEEAQAKLNAIDSIQLQGENFSIGKYVKRVPRSRISKREAGITIGEILDNTEKNWYDRIIGILVEDPTLLDLPPVFEKKEGKLMRFNPITDQYEEDNSIPDEKKLYKGMKRSLTSREAIGLFFNGKRSIERLTKLQEYINAEVTSRIRVNKAIVRLTNLIDLIWTKLIPVNLVKAQAQHEYRSTTLGRPGMIHTGTIEPLREAPNF